jgi:hypothetical protein
MNAIKKIFGIVCMALGLGAGYYGVTDGLGKITNGKQEDLVFGIVIVFVLTPIIVGGLILFGKYAWQGEYSE